MGFWSDVARVGVGVGTLGGSEVFNEASGGGLYGNGSTFLGDSGSKSDPNAGMAQNNANIMAGARKRGIDKQNKFYGSSIDDIGQESADYANMVKGNLDKNVAKADIYNQQAGQQRALDNARAGLSGTDTSAMNEQSRRNAQFGAAAINEDAKRNALDMYGQSISNRITGANTIDTQEQALGIASLQQPVAQAGQGGILGSIFGGLFS
jgi:hypothetical protein